MDATVPAKSTWYNSTYFDEIYHARTAQEHIQGVYPYEVTHPPLGKLILGIGIRLFGMTPFGWRFMGTLFGVGMLPILYVFLKNLFGKTPTAACGTILFAVDFMHLTQTRIATIDTYGVFFILCMYFFLYRYLTLPAGTSFRQGALPLFLSGLMWGLGAASKWTVIYAAVGLAVLYFMGFYQKLRDWPEEQRGERAVWCVKTLAFSVLCFVVIPLCIYCAAYLPYAMAKGDTSLKGLLSTVWNNQKYMLHYHEGVNQSHPYSSRWYQWIVDGRPILYYMDNTVPGFTTRFAAFCQPRASAGRVWAHVILCAVTGLPPPLGQGMPPSCVDWRSTSLQLVALDVHRPHHLRIPLLPIHPLSGLRPLLPVQRPHGGATRAGGDRFTASPASRWDCTLSSTPSSLV